MSYVIMVNNIVLRTILLNFLICTSDFIEIICDISVSG